MDFIIDNFQNIGIIISMVMVFIMFWPMMTQSGVAPKTEDDLDDYVMSPKELKDKQHQLYDKRVQDVQDGKVLSSPVQPNSMFESVNKKQSSNYKFDLK